MIKPVPTAPCVSMSVALHDGGKMFYLLTLSSKSTGLQSCRAIWVESGLTWRAFSPRCNVSSSSVTTSSYLVPGSSTCSPLEESRWSFFSRSDIVENTVWMRVKTDENGVYYSARIFHDPYGTGRQFLQSLPLRVFRSLQAVLPLELRRRQE
jgi:hypothetical protein